MKKSLLAFFIIISMLMLCSCVDKELNNPMDPTDRPVNLSKPTFSQEGGSYTTDQNPSRFGANPSNLVNSSDFKILRSTTCL